MFDSLRFGNVVISALPSHLIGQEFYKIAALAPTPGRHKRSRALHNGDHRVNRALCQYPLPGHHTLHRSAVVSLPKFLDSHHGIHLRLVEFPPWAPDQNLVNSPILIADRKDIDVSVIQPLIPGVLLAEQFGDLRFIALYKPLVSAHQAYLNLLGYFHRRGYQREYRRIQSEQHRVHFRLFPPVPARWIGLNRA
jgi:hypothetical protein